MVKRIETASEIKVGDELRGGGIVSKITEINDGIVINDRGEKCPVSTLQGFIDKGVVIVSRWE